MPDENFENDEQTNEEIDYSRNEISEKNRQQNKGEQNQKPTTQKEFKSKINKRIEGLTQKTGRTRTRVILKRLDHFRRANGLDKHMYVSEATLSEMWNSPKLTLLSEPPYSHIGRKVS